MERYLRVNLLGPGPRLMKKKFTGPQSDKGWVTLFQKAFPTHDVISPVNLPFIVCRIFHFSLPLCNTTVFIMWLLQLISVVLQHHISKLPRYFCYTFQSVQVSAPHEAMLQMQHFSSKSDLLVKRVFLMNDAFAMAILDLISHVYLALFVVMRIVEIFHIFQLFLIYRNLQWGVGALRI